MRAVTLRLAAQHQESAAAPRHYSSLDSCRKTFPADVRPCAARSSRHPISRALRMRGKDPRVRAWHPRIPHRPLEAAMTQGEYARAFLFSCLLLRGFRLRRAAVPRRPNGWRFSGRASFHFPEAEPPQRTHRVPFQPRRRTQRPQREYHVHRQTQPCLVRAAHASPHAPRGKVERDHDRSLGKCSCHGHCFSWECCSVLPG